jgi:hypothetical protein
MTPTNNQLERLPKWARDHINLLTMRLAEANDVLARQRGGQRSRVLVEPNGYNSAPEYYARDTATVRFMLGDDWTDHIDLHMIKDNNGKRGVLVRGGNTRLMVHPVSSNHVDIYLLDN